LYIKNRLNTSKNFVIGMIIRMAKERTRKFGEGKNVGDVIRWNSALQEEEISDEME
jgi:hypothetical protein